MSREIEFEQSDIVDQDIMDALGLKVKGRQLVDDEDGEVFADLTEDEYQRWLKRQTPGA